jgi:hypothetical protein
MTIQANFPAIKPSLLLDFQNTKQLDSRITYTRASTATFYNGVTTAMAEQNLITYSNEISTARWSASGETTTINNATAPDGTTTATLLTADNSADARLRLITNQVNNTTYTFSVYGKAGTGSWLRLRNAYKNPDANAWFDLTNGVVGTATNCTSTITSVGSGWYRCTLTASIVTGDDNLVDIGNTNADNSQAGTAGQTIYVWGVQLETRSSVSALTVTTTQAITNYIPVLQTAASGVARFDNNPTTGESLGLLIEESRSNIFLYSEQPDNGAWNQSSAISTQVNTIVAPDGALTGDAVLETTATSSHLIGQQISVTTGSYTLSIFAKYKGRQLSVYGQSAGTAYAVFNLQTGAVTTTGGANYVSSSITSVGNGWYRCALTLSVTTGTLWSRLYLSNDGTASPSYAGDGFSGIFIWGAQLEAGAFATSYIPTVASQVTRAADAASMTGTNFSTWYNQGEGTTYIDAVAGNNGSYAFSISDGTNNNYLIGGRYASSGTAAVVATNGSFQASFGTGALTAKVAFAYKVNDFAVSTNAGTAATDTAGLVPVVNQIRIGAAQDGGVVLNGTIKKISYYPLRLSNTNLVALTS